MALAGTVAAPAAAGPDATMKMFMDRIGQLENRLLQQPQQEREPISALVSALATLQGMTAEPAITAAQITQAALQAHDPLSLQTLETFCAFLGTVAGDLALTLGARGGVYLGGGILPHWRAWLAQSPFRARFEAKGRYRDYMAAIPVWWIDAPTSPALLGAARALTLQAI